jgi:hypothetical protein
MNQKTKKIFVTGKLKSARLKQNWMLDAIINQISKRLPAQRIHQTTDFIFLRTKS